MIGKKQCMLLYMFGFVNYVIDVIMEGRCYNLDVYVKSLFVQLLYILKCDLVKQFFVLWEGDYEIDFIV